jgi:hypothetical protein
VAKLPPIPNPPLRPPPRQQGFADTEAPTKPKNETAAVYTSLLSIFDAMTPAERMRFVDLASAYHAMSFEEQDDLLAQAITTVFPEGN